MHVLLIGFVTLALCWVLSHLLWRAGVEPMAARHALALGGAYVAYLGLLWLWARWLLSRHEPEGGVPDLGGALPSRGSPSGRGGTDDALPRFEPGGGGDFAGAGAGGSWDGAAGDAIGSVAEAAGSLDEGAVVVVPLAVVVGVAVLIASALGFAVVGLFGIEVLLGVAVEIAFASVGGALALKARREGWLSFALRRTALPMLATLACAVALGLALDAWLPGARTLPQALQRLR